LPQAVAATVVALQLCDRLPGGRLPMPLAFAWIQASFVPRHAAAAALWDDDLAAAAASFNVATTPTSGGPPPPPRVLVTTAENDGLVPRAATEDLARRFPGATFVAFPGKGHKLASLKDDSSAAVQAVRAFFDGLRLAAAGAPGGGDDDRGAAP